MSQGRRRTQSLYHTNNTTYIRVRGYKWKHLHICDNNNTNWHKCHAIVHPSPRREAQCRGSRSLPRQLHYIIIKITCRNSLLAVLHHSGMTFHSSTCPSDMTKRELLSEREESYDRSLRKKYRDGTCKSLQYIPDSFCIFAPAV